MEEVFTNLLDLVGTFAFAISGIRLASGKQIDWFGAYLIGLATAIGGGTVRDLLLDARPFWMQDGKYFLVTAFALLVTIVLKDQLLKWNKQLFLFDTIGLGLFTIVGITKSFLLGFPFWVCIIMGTITGSIGGVIRDVLINEVPLLLRRDIYALACIAGGLIYFACLELNIALSITQVVASLVVILIRVLALKYHIHLPVLPSTEANDKPAGD